MSLVTKGMGSHHLVGAGYGYSFSWKQLVQQCLGGGGATPWPRPSYSSQPYLSRRPRRESKEPVEPRKPFDPWNIRHDTPKPVVVQATTGTSAGAQIVILVVMGAAFVGAICLLGGPGVS